MACVPSPSVTIWGTTQITQTSSYFTTWTSLAPQQPGVDIMDGRVVVKGAQQTVTSSSLVETLIVIPSIVPQRTLFYPCVETKTAVLAPAFTQATESTPASTAVVVPPFVAVTTTATSSSSSATTLSTASSSSTSQIPSSSLSTAESTTTPTSRSTTTAVAITTGPPIGAQPPPSALSPTSATTSADTGTANEASSRTHSSNTVPIIAAIVGVVVGIALLVGLWLCCRRRRRRHPADGGDNARGNESDGDYWERKFNALDSEASSPQVEEKGVSALGRPESPETRRLRLTLDLHSKDLPTRPVSTLSMISAFFGRTLPVASRRAGPEPINPDIKGYTTGSGGNFSRPLRQDDRYLAPAEYLDRSPPPLSQAIATESEVAPHHEGRPRSPSDGEAEMPSPPMQRTAFRPLSRLSFKRMSTTFTASPDEITAFNSMPFAAERVRASPPSSRETMEWVNSTYTYDASAGQYHHGDEATGQHDQPMLPWLRPEPIRLPPPPPLRKDNPPPGSRILLDSDRSKRLSTRLRLSTNQREQLEMDIGGDRRPSDLSILTGPPSSAIATLESAATALAHGGESLRDITRASTATFGPLLGSPRGPVALTRASHRPPRLELDQPSARAGQPASTSSIDSQLADQYLAGISVFSPDTEVGHNHSRSSVDSTEEVVSVDQDKMFRGQPGTPYTAAEKGKWRATSDDP